MFITEDYCFFLMANTCLLAYYSYIDHGHELCNLLCTYSSFTLSPCICFLSIYLSFIYLSTYLSIFLSIYLFYLSIFLFLSIYLLSRPQNQQVSSVPLRMGKESVFNVTAETGFIMINQLTTAYNCSSYRFITI